MAAVSVNGERFATSYANAQADGSSFTVFKVTRLTRIQSSTLEVGGAGALCASCDLLGLLESPWGSQLDPCSRPA